MDTLPKDISRLIAVLLDGPSLHKMIICNRHWFVILSDEQTWKIILSVQFLTEPFPRLTAYQSYQCRYNWEKHAQFICAIFSEQMRECPYKIHEEVIPYFQKAIKKRTRSLWCVPNDGMSL
jgi:hypothetical protein